MGDETVGESLPLMMCFEAVLPAVRNKLVQAPDLCIAMSALSAAKLPNLSQINGRIERIDLSPNLRRFSTAACGTMYVIAHRSEALLCKRKIAILGRDRNTSSPACPLTVLALKSKFVSNYCLAVHKCQVFQLFQLREGFATC